MRVLVAGAAAWNTMIQVERLPSGRPETLFAGDSWETLGGTSAGKALNLARLGHEVHLHALLGDDEAGERVRAVLGEAGVHVHAEPDALETERHVNLMAADGSRLSVYRHVATPRDDLDLTPLVALAAQCDAVVLDITDHVRRLIDPLDARGIPFWTDLHDWDGIAPYQRDFAEHAARVVLSDTALGGSVDAVCGALAKRAELVACTHGAAGATAWHGDEVVRVPAEPVDEVVDTNGAGDAFTAGLVHGVHQGWPLPDALRAGAIAGAAAVTSRELASPRLDPALVAP